MECMFEFLCPAHYGRLLSDTALSHTCRHRETNKSQISKQLLRKMNPQIAKASLRSFCTLFSFKDAAVPLNTLSPFILQSI